MPTTCDGPQRARITSVKAPLPQAQMRESKLIDGVLWNGEAPDQYADSFAIRYQANRPGTFADADLLSVA